MKSSLDATPIQLPPSTACDAQELQSQYEKITTFLETSLTPAYVASLGNSLESLFYLYGSLIGSDAWNGCLSLRDSLVVPTAGTETILTSRCTAAPGSAEFDADPCCSAVDQVINKLRNSRLHPISLPSTKYVSCLNASKPLLSSRLPSLKSSLYPRLTVLPKVRGCLTILPFMPMF